MAAALQGSLLVPLEPHDAPDDKIPIALLHKTAVRLISHAGVETGPFAEGDADALLVRGRRIVPELELTLTSAAALNTETKRFLPVRDYHPHVGEFSVATSFEKIRFCLRNTGDRPLEVLPFAGVRRDGGGYSLHSLTNSKALESSQTRNSTLYSSSRSLIVDANDEVKNLRHDDSILQDFDRHTCFVFVLCYVRAYRDGVDEETPLNMFMF